MKKEYFNKMIFWFVLFCMILFTLVSIAKGQTYINPGICYINSTTNGTDVCAFNSTIVNINMTLNPGELKNLTDNNCYVSALCLANNTYINNTNTSSNKCIIQKDLSNGEEFSYNSAICEINIKSQNITCNTCEKRATAQYIEAFRIRYSNVSNAVQIDFAKNTYIATIGKVLDVQGEMKYDCPVSVINESSGVKATVEECKAIVPLYCNELASVMIKKFDGAVEKAKEYEDKLENCRVQKTLMVQSSVCIANEKYAELLAQNSALNNASESCIFKEGTITYENNDLKNDKSVLSIMMFLLIFSNALFIVMWWKSKPPMEKIYT